MRLVVILGIPFCLAAALTSFLITYNEYSHHYKDKRLAVRIALNIGTVTFAVFVVIVVAIGFILARVITQ